MAGSFTTGSVLPSRRCLGHRVQADSDYLELIQARPDHSFRVDKTAVGATGAAENAAFWIAMLGKPRGRADRRESVDADRYPSPRESSSAPPESGFERDQAKTAPPRSGAPCGRAPDLSRGLCHRGPGSSPGRGRGRGHAPPDQWLSRSPAAFTSHRYLRHVLGEISRRTSRPVSGPGHHRRPDPPSAARFGRPSSTTRSRPPATSKAEIRILAELSFDQRPVQRRGQSGPGSPGSASACRCHGRRRSSRTLPNIDQPAGPRHAWRSFPAAACHRPSGRRRGEGGAETGSKRSARARSSPRSPVPATSR